MKFNPVQVFSIIAIFQALFISVHLTTIREGDRPTNIILSAFLFCFAIQMMIALTLTIGIERYFLPYHKPLFLLRQIALLIGPLLYVLIRALTVAEFKFRRRDVLHLVPFLSAVVCYGIVLVSREPFVIWLSDLWMISTVLILMHILVYIALTAVMLWKKPFSLKSLFSGPAHRKLSWVSLLISGTIVVWVIELNSLVILEVLRRIEYCPHIASLYSAFTFLIFTSIAYCAFARPELFRTNRRYVKSRLEESSKNNYHSKLVEHMATARSFRNPSLTLTGLAEELGIPHRELSQVINEKLGMNFYNFLNQYRVEESKRLLSDTSNGRVNILDTGFAVGFNSKSAFNTAFKKHTGITPTEFKRRSGKQG